MDPRFAWRTRPQQENMGQLHNMLQAAREQEVAKRLGGSGPHGGQGVGGSLRASVDYSQQQQQPPVIVASAQYAGGGHLLDAHGLLAAQRRTKRMHKPGAGKGVWFGQGLEMERKKKADKKLQKDKKALARSKRNLDRVGRNLEAASARMEEQAKSIEENTQQHIASKY
jgi:hypothetical protein